MQYLIVMGRSGLVQRLRILLSGSNEDVELTKTIYPHFRLFSLSFKILFSFGRNHFFFVLKEGMIFLSKGGNDFFLSEGGNDFFCPKTQLWDKKTWFLHREKEDFETFLKKKRWKTKWKKLLTLKKKRKIPAFHPFSTAFSL